MELKEGTLIDEDLRVTLKKVEIPYQGEKAEL